MKLIRNVFVVGAIGAMIVLSSSCNRSKIPTKKYAFTGRVVSIDSQSHTAMIDGDNVPGFMEAMAMEYKVKPETMLKQLMPGDSISADLIVVGPDPKDPESPPDSWLENIKVTGHAASPPAKGANSLHMPVRGEDVPDFAFVNQDGKKISLSQYRGHVLVVTFIYTRCPFTDFCPRMSANFDEVYKQFATNQSLAKTHLLSVSFDPEHDTPKVLRRYGFSVAHTNDAALFRRWEFAAAWPDEMPKLEEFFALTVTPQGGMLTHNLSTAIIGPDGKIADWYHGNDWQVSDLIKDAEDASAERLSQRGPA